MQSLRDNIGQDNENRSLKNLHLARHRGAVQYSELPLIMTNGDRNDDMDLFDSLFTQMKENLTLPSFEPLGMFTQNSIKIYVRSWITNEGKS